MEENTGILSKNYPDWIGTHRTYAHPDRGVMFSLSGDSSIRFPDTKYPMKAANGADYYPCRPIQIKDENGNWNDEGVKLCQLIEKTGAFRKQKIVYIPNPEEAAERARLSKQAEAVKMVRGLINDGLFTADIDKLKAEETRNLAAKLHLRLGDEKGKARHMLSLKSEIKAVLGIAENDKEKK